MLNLGFTLSTQTQALAAQPGAPSVLHPVFSADAQTPAGWSLQVFGDENASLGTPATADAAGVQLDALQAQGLRLYSQTTGLPWVPHSYWLTGPDGTRYSLDAQGRLTGVRFADRKSVV